MVGSFLAAGGQGLNRELDRMDILETPYPDVEEFLEPNEFVFTSFWNSKDNKEARVGLIKSMIRHNCAGIAIMAGLHLGGKIDDEILALGNQYDFPVISIDTTLRYSDIIKEFYCFKHDDGDAPEMGLTDVYAILSDIDDFHSHMDIPRLCKSLARNLGTPVIILSRDAMFASALDLPEETKRKIITKIYDVRTSSNCPRNASISLPINHSLSVLCAFWGATSVVAAVISNTGFSRHNMGLLHGATRFVASRIDKMSRADDGPANINEIDAKLQYYCFYVSKENIGHMAAELAKHCIVLDVNEVFNYAICLIDQEKVSSGTLFKEYGKIIETFAPRCFVFTEMCFELARIRELIKILIQQINHMHLLNGIFTFGEISILSLLYIAPYSFKKPIIDFNADTLDYRVNPLSLDTLRLFIVLKSITKVSELLHLHPNTVKYRILKSIKNPALDTTNITADMWTLDYLIPLENAKLENIMRNPREIAQ
jgi:hypothetical protein